jgi:hypothetical protein
VSGESIEGVRAVTRRQNTGACVFEEQPRGVPYQLVIVNDEDRETPHQRE